MQTHGCHTLVFSSSATLYGYPEAVPISETAPIAPINPYGHTKAAVERMLADLHASAPDSWRIACLRYFNPVGAHPPGRIGENPLGIPNNLFPFVSQVAVGRRAQLQVFGGDWPTPDCTGVRDFIHVMDLAEGHRAALDCLLAEAPQLLTLQPGQRPGTVRPRGGAGHGSRQRPFHPLCNHRSSAWRCRHQRRRSQTSR